MSNQNKNIKKTLPWYVYLIQTTNNKIYCGITTNLQRRFNEHKFDKRKRAKFFNMSQPLKIVYFETHDNRSLASKRESIIKKFTKQQKEELILKFNQIFEYNQKPSELNQENI